jgi:hypothetical protein
MIKPIISPDQNSLQIGANKYTFIATGKVSCMFCDFNISNDCSSIPCVPFTRDDKKNGYFMLLKQ